MAGETNVSELAIKAGLQQFEAAGSMIRVEEMVGRMMLRVIYPRDPHRHRGSRAPEPRGGVPKGTDPKARMAKKAGVSRAQPVAPLRLEIVEAIATI